MKVGILKLKNKHACPALLALLLGSTSLSHAEIGLGMLLDPYGSTVYLPMKLSEHYRLEPSVAYFSREADGRIRWKAWELALGAFRATSISDNTRIYYGGRVGYFERNDDSNFNDEQGVRLAPTLGFEYFFTDSLSISGEGAITYAKADRPSPGLSEFGGREHDNEIISTDSSIIIRYMF